MNEKYNLSWQTFSEHILLMFKELYEEGKYSDVTLISDDQYQFKAHKIVLSACSPVFKNIIDSNPSQHSLIYLRGIQSYEMDSILQFMYLGEGRFYYERMEEFYKVAKDLEVREISNSVEIPNVEEVVIEETAMDDEEKDAEPTQTSENKIRQRQSWNQISSDAKSTECPECGKEFAQRSAMVTHYRSIHQGIKYPCNKCNTQFTDRSSLRKHIKSKHESIKYPCNQCDFRASYQSQLQTHIQTKHEGVRYPCNQCGYQATTQRHLHRHVQSIHEGIKYPCNQCDFQTTRQDNLQKHIQSKHVVSL